MLRDFFAAAGRSENRYAPSNDLIGLVPEKRLGPAVPARNRSIQRHSVDGVIGRLDHRRQQGSGFLCRFALGDIRAENRDAHDFPIGNDRTKR